MCRPVDTKKWRMWLYVINSTMIVLGLSILGLSIWGLAARSAVVFRAQYFPLVIGGLVMSLVVLGVSGIGCGGALKAQRRQKAGRRNWCLSIYFVLLSLLMCVQVGVMAASFISHSQLHSAAEVPYDPYHETDFDREIADKFLLAHPATWKLIQDDFQCCGWGASDNSSPTKPALSALVQSSASTGAQATGSAAASGEAVPADAPTDPPPPPAATRNSALETGDACGTVHSVPCRGVMFAWVEDDLVWVVAISLIIVIIEIIALVSAFCIAFCAKLEDYEYAEHKKSGKAGAHEEYERPEGEHYTALSGGKDYNV